MIWEPVERPGYFGRRRDERIAQLDERYGKDRWQLAWWNGSTFVPFKQACEQLYEESYFRYLSKRPDDIDFICSFVECYDNDISNVKSGCDYTVQENWSTHIQDIAIRNVLRRLGRKFKPAKPPHLRFLRIRSADSNGYRFGPGNIPFLNPDIIVQPSKRPEWANAWSVEDAWQSNKYVLHLRET